MIRVQARVEGTVQGVGFRPYVHRLAGELGLGGYVLNDADGVLVEVEAAPDAVERFMARLAAEAPPLATVERVLRRPMAPTGETGFAIRPSPAGAEARTPVTADSATCEDCLRELFDPADRRFRYPFTNCTNCGPRFTIVRSVPYDRPRTTMAGFTMCPACRAEYEDPADRRFHAQPNACPECGPKLSVPLADAVEVLRGGGIVAVKGLGGFHLACLAGDEAAVARLRARKHREEKPFAVMSDEPGALAQLGPVEEALLRSHARPIVLAARRPDAPLAPSVAPGLREVGLMLPYTPLHHLLLHDCGAPLVMTSGNVSDEPIAYRDTDARERLAGIADLVVGHDRPIQTRTDDSVVRVVRGRALPVRRSRGYVPDSLPLPVPATAPLLAVGAHLKSTFCVAKGRRAWVSHHIGDLDTWETLASFREGIAHFEALFAVAPAVVAHDLHPEYLSTKHARELEGVELVGVQHHHAHLAAVLAEHGLGPAEPAVGAIFDGTGWGPDGTVWGGELLAGDLGAYERAGHLRPVPLPGGEAAIREPWRMACAWLHAAGAEPPAHLAELPRWEAIAQLAATGFASPLTSSAGRLCDAVAALCGVRTAVSYEGQAAIELEAAADPSERGAYPVDVGEDLVLDPRPLIAAVARDVAAGVRAPVVSARFHRGLARATAAACTALARRRGIERGVLAGGVFQNRLLLEGTAGALERAGLEVLVPERLPPGDGAIAYGQAAVAAARGSG